MQGAGRALGQAKGRRDKDLRTKDRSDGYDAAEVTDMPDRNMIEVVDHLWDWQVVEGGEAEEEASGQEAEEIVANDSSLAPINIVKPAKQKDRNPPWTPVEDTKLRRSKDTGEAFTKIRPRFKNWTFDFISSKWQNVQQTTLDANHPEIREMLSDVSTSVGIRGEARDQVEARDRYLKGSWVTLYWKRGLVHVVLYGLPVFFPADFKLQPEAKKVKVKVQLSPDGTTSAHCAVNASNCIDEDPARRLEILTSAYSVEGRRITCWGEARDQLFCANTLVDYLQGVDFGLATRSTCTRCRLRTFYLLGEPRDLQIYWDIYCIISQW